MRAITFFIFIFLFCSLQLHAGWSLDFKRHNFEISNAVGLDYGFVVRKNAGPLAWQFIKSNERAFPGFCFGLHYTYRPLRWFGLSTGLENMVYGYKLGNDYRYIVFSDALNTNLGIQGLNIPGLASLTLNSNGFWGYMAVPAFVHAFYQTRKLTFEFITGPEFFFQVYNIYKSVIYDNYQPEGLKTTSYYSTLQIKQSATLAWDAQLLTNFYITRIFSVSVGPEWKFLNLRSLASGNTVDYGQTRSVPFFLGAKMALCFGSNLWKSEKEPKSKKTAQK